jgi:hypothetical protein
VSSRSTAHDRSARLIRRYAASNRARARFEDALRAVLDGLWLGMFDHESLALLDEAHYATLVERGCGTPFSYSDETYNQRGLQPWETAAVTGAFPPGGRVVVTGAGGGREVLGLLELGFDAVGFEPHPGLVRAGGEILAAEGHGERLRPMGRDAFPSDAGELDALVVGWGSYMLIPGRSRRVAFLRDARRSMRPGSPVLMSFFVRSPELRDLHRLAAIAGVVRRLRRREPAEVGDALRPNYVHFFTRDEIAGELSEAGFRLEQFEAEPYGHAVGRAV